MTPGETARRPRIIAILKAFLDKRTWAQAELARHVGAATPAVQKRLRELQESGIPLERESEHPHVYWSVPNNGYPGGVLFTGEQVKQLVRQLARVPKSKVRDQLIQTADVSTQRDGAECGAPARTEREGGAAPLGDRGVGEPEDCVAL